jgi:transcriptional regulator with XRE-family HTH domain
VARRTHLIDGNFTPGSLTPAALTLQEFSRRLYRLMLGKGWTQAELARQSGMTRDSISGYVRGNHMPTHDSVKNLAKALGVKPEELLPNIVETAIDEDTPSLELKVSTSDPSKSWLRVNRLVSTKAAGEVINLLNEDAEKIASKGGR